MFDQTVRPGSPGNTRRSSLGKVRTTLTSVLIGLFVAACASQPVLMPEPLRPPKQESAVDETPGAPWLDRAFAPADRTGSGTERLHPGPDAAGKGAEPDPADDPHPAGLAGAGWRAARQLHQHRLRHGTGAAGADRPVPAQPFRTAEPELGQADAARAGLPRRGRGAAQLQRARRGTGWRVALPADGPALQ
ncbi:hypothetical protein H1235_03460 [Pseudoxanthomonas sp. NC8]|nr:hypothetical protein H1235_03460 [Pseudoxanthomonas sp. NC8]